MVIPEVYIRNDVMEDMTEWAWVLNDTGTWDGPAREWPLMRDKVLSLLPSERRRSVVQAGGAFGMYPRLWSNHFEKVYTFEPFPMSFHVLGLNCRKPNIFKFQAALTNSFEPKKVIHHSETNYGMNSVIPLKDDTYGVPVALLRIDDLKLEDVDVIQLDIEGGEEHALQGALETIERTRPVITLETVNEPILAILNRFGYKEQGHAGYDRAFSVG